MQLICALFGVLLFFAAGVPLNRSIQLGAFYAAGFIVFVALVCLRFLIACLVVWLFCVGTGTGFLVAVFIYLVEWRVRTAIGLEAVAPSRACAFPPARLPAHRRAPSPARRHRRCSSCSAASRSPR